MIRKPKFKTAIVGAAVLALSLVGLTALPASAVADTFTPDNLLGTDTQGSTTLPNSGDAAVKLRMEQFANVPIGSLVLDSESNSPAVGTDDAGNFFIDVEPDEPLYFVLHFGAGTTNEPTHYFFQNIAELTKLVWDSTQVALSSERISFYRAYVPLPAAAWFLLTALAGLFGMRWWRGRDGEAVTA